MRIIDIRPVFSTDCSGSPERIRLYTGPFALRRGCAMQNSKRDNITCAEKHGSVFSGTVVESPLE
jgi:hypothetical protein